MRASIIYLTLFLSGCSLLSSPADQPLNKFNPAEQKERIKNLNNWELTGKIALRTKHSSETANLYWQQQLGFYRIELTGPFGQGGASIEGADKRVKLSIAGKGEYYANSPEQLIQNKLGWTLPVQQIHWWLKGSSAPTTKVLDLKYKQQLLSEFQQDGWLIKYLGYQPVDGLWLPRKIKLYHNKVKMTLIIKNWEML